MADRRAGHATRRRRPSLPLEEARQPDQAHARRRQGGGARGRALTRRHGLAGDWAAGAGRVRRVGGLAGAARRLMPRGRWALWPARRRNARLQGSHSPNATRLETQQIPAVALTTPTRPAEFESLREILREYAHGLGVDLC